jgi:hypothetical protein
VQSKKNLLKQILRRFGKEGKNLDAEFYELDLHAVQRYLERTDTELLETLKLFLILENLTKDIPTGHWIYVYRGSKLIGGFPIRADKKPRTFLLKGMETDGIMVVDGKIFIGSDLKVKKLSKPEYWKWVPTEKGGDWVKIKDSKLRR